MKKKIGLYIIILFISIIAISLTIFLFVNNDSNLIKLNYSEIINKVENKEDFVLCVSASECVHCNEYKPKLKKISNEYDITIYYTDIDDFKDEDYDEFKSRFSFDGGTPITIFFKDGEEKTTATRIEGNEKYDRIINKLKKNGFINE